MSYYFIAIVPLIYLFYKVQFYIIYPSYMHESRTAVTLPSAYKLPYKEVTLCAKDGIKTKAWIISKPGATTNLLFFHANAGNIGHRLPVFEILYRRMNCNIIALSYRGYGLSEGTPSETGIKMDVDALVEFIQNDDELKDYPRIAMGESLGGAVAIYCANRHNVSALILENTFTSIPDVVPYVFPILARFAFLCHQKWNSHSLISSVTVPVLFISCLKDEIIPPMHMRQLRDAIKSTTIIWKEFANGTHNTAAMQNGYFETVTNFVNRFN